MTSEKQAVVLLAAANPIPDEESLDLDSVTAQLTELTHGSSDMTQLSTKQEDKQDRKARPLIWLAAAVTALLLGAVLLLTNRASEEIPPATDPVPTTVAEPVPTTAPETTPTTQGAPATTIDRAEASWQAIPLPIFGFDAGGQYRTGDFFVPAAYTVPDASWERMIESVEYLWLCKEPDDVGNCQAAVWLFDPLASSVDEAVDSLTSRPGPTFSEPEPVEVGGASGRTFQVAAGQEPHILHEFSNAFDQIALHIGDQGQGSVLDIDGTSIGIYLFTSQGGESLDEAQAIVDSIVWKDLN